MFGVAVKKILMIDDEQELLGMLKHSLERSGEFEVICAYNGKEGFKLAKKYLPDLILLDIIMPKMNGFEVLKALKDYHKTVSIPVIMVSACNDENSKLEAARLFNEDYIAKPVDPLLLKERIHNVLSRFEGA